MPTNNGDLTRVEFAVKVKGQQCVDKVKSSLTNGGISENKIETIVDSGEARLVISTDRPWIEVHELIEKTGYESALVGFSNQSAVSILDKGDTTNIKGVIRLCSSSGSSSIVLDGVIDGLEKETPHTFSICEYGDLSDGCNNLGNVYKNGSYAVKSNEVGRVILRTKDDNLIIPELIGRGVCISNGDERLACGVISRSAGVFQNFKRICLCSGKLLWEERDLQNIVKK